MARHTGVKPLGMRAVDLEKLNEVRILDLKTCGGQEVTCCQLYELRSFKFGPSRNRESQKPSEDGNTVNSHSIDHAHVKYFTRLSPTLFNAGTPHSQLSSCFPVCMKG